MRLILFISLLMITVAQAQSVYPNVFTTPNQVQVSIYNYTQKDINCSGTIYITTQSGKFETRYYYQRIYRGMSDFRTFPNFDYNDPFMHSHHSINCFGY